MTDLDARVQVCCYLIYACERVRDHDRAAQWCAYMKDMTTRWKYPMMFSYCRMHYAGVLIWRGAWAEAEATLVAATNDLVATRPAEAAAEHLRSIARYRCVAPDAAARLATRPRTSRPRTSCCRRPASTRRWRPWTAWCIRR